jgi:uncharacterized protein YhfF
VTGPATPLGEIDTVEVAAFWRRFLEATGRDVTTPMPEAGPFGDSVELADELIALVLAGTKRATAGSVDGYAADGEPLPQVGDLGIATDGRMRPRAVIEITEVRVGPLSSVDAQFAEDEGEGDRTLTYWLEAHTAFFQRTMSVPGAELDPDMPTVFQRFNVVHRED